ncbi:MAG: tetratricopeptide repeat protein [Aquificae bacterium]|nr:tetratricopeptide repeat protein [Aquificota bacterium]
MKKLLFTLFISGVVSCAPLNKTQTYKGEENIYYYYVACIHAKNKNKPDIALQYCEKAVQQAPELESLYQEAVALAFLVKDKERAKKIIDQYYKRKFKKDPFYYDYFSILYQQVGEEEKAEKLLIEGVKNFPDNEYLLSKLIRFYKRKNQIQKAEKIIKEILKENPDKGSLYFALGVLSVEKGDINSAVKYLEKAVAVSKKPAYIMLLADLYYQKRDLDKAEKLYKQILEKDPDNLKALESLFQIYVLTEQNEKAKQIIDKLTKLRPDIPDFWYKKYLLYIKMGKSKEIIKEIEEKLVENPNNQTLIRILALAYEDIGEYQLAKEMYLKALDYFPNDVELLYRLAEVYTKLKEYDMAIDVLKRIYQLTQDYRVYLAMAEVEEERGNLQKAIQYALKAKELKPDDYLPYFYLAIYYDNLDQWEKAEKYLKEALKIRPNFPDALNYLGYSYINRGIDIDKGIELVKKALKLSPNNPAYIDSLGWGYFKKGDYQRAYKLLKQAHEKMPEDPVITEHLAEVLEALGKKEEALKLYKKALEIIQKTGKEGEKGLKDRILQKIRELENGDT